MTSTFISNAVRQNRDLFALICRFNCLPARDIHPDHYAETITPALWTRLQDSRRGERQLSRWVAAHWDWDDAGIWDFEDPIRRLALLDCATLSQLMRWAGAAVYSDRITRVVDRQGQNQLREALGEELYLFALKRAPFLVSNLPEELAGPLNANPSAQLLGAGRACLAACLANQPRELTRRMALKVPRNLKFDPTPALAGDHRGNIWKMLRRILLSEINPQLSPCFN